jgi:ProQ/FINO family
MKDLTPAERARRAAVLGVVLPAPAESATPRRSEGHRSDKADPGSPRSASKLTATSTMRAALLARTTPVPAPSPPPAKQAEQATRSIPAKHARYRRAHDLLVERYPAIFAAARPLAIGVDKQLREAFSEEELSTANLRAFLRTWVNRNPYRAALARGDSRVNLDGSDAGPAFD